MSLLLLHDKIPIYLLGTYLNQLPWFDRFTVNLGCIAEIAYGRRAIGLGFVRLNPHVGSTEDAFVQKKLRNVV